MIRNFLASLFAAASDRKGVTAAEYAILAVAVVIIVGIAATQFGNSLVAAFTAIGTEITAAQSNASGVAGGTAR